jgi:FixJ family two-component response regulator
MSVIWLLDDDSSVLRGLERLLGCEGFETRPFQDPSAFLESIDTALPGCAIIDLGLNGVSGLDVQERLSESGQALPVIFLTGQGSIPAAVLAMRAGAVDFLTKPVDGAALIAAITAALEADDARRRRSTSQDEVRSLLLTLTPREHEVLHEVVAGRLNKQIAHRLGTAEKTIKVHRGRMMHKMGVKSVAELVTLMARLQDRQSG